MKKALAIFTLFTMSLLASDNCATSCCECPGPVCNPCTITPPVANHQNECGSFFVSAEFIFWCAKETDLPQSVQVIGINDGNGDTLCAVKDVFNLPSTWTPGFKVGLGWNTPCENILRCNYTWIQPNRAKKRSVPSFAVLCQDGQKALVSPYFTPDYNIPTADVERITTDYTLHFNQVDLDIGRHFWISSKMTLHPFFGLRGAFNETHFSIKGEQVTDQETIFIRFNRDFWGVGLLSGFNTTFQFTNCFSLYGDAAFSLLWSHSDIKRKGSFTNTGIAHYTSSSTTSCRNSQTIFDLGTGLRYIYCLCENQYRLNIDLGWEFHNWIGYSRLPSFTGSESHVAFNHGDLILTGVTLRTKFEF